MQEYYKFRVGVRTLNSPSGSGVSIGSSGFNHACLLLNKDLFEYGSNEKKTYERHKDVGRKSTFDWDEVGEALNGTTTISPDQLETAIKNNKGWGENTYDLVNHNCHDFVQFCLDRIGCPASMIQKKWLCYRKQKKQEEKEEKEKK